jgi:hypothetical protein
LSDSFLAFIKIGDMGGRIYLYYAECEERLHQRRGLRRLTEGRYVDSADYSILMSQHSVAQDERQWSSGKRTSKWWSIL